MILSQLRKIEDLPSLSIKELIQNLSNNMDQQISFLLIDGSNRKFSFYQKLKQNKKNSFAENSDIDDKIILFLKALGNHPVKLSSEQITNLSSFDFVDPVWVVPMLTSEQTDIEKVTVEKWLLLVAPENLLNTLMVENLYLKIGWALTSLLLQQSKQELTKANAWIDHELDEMTRLQQLMLPDKDTKIPGIEIAFTYRALRGAGGDYIDFVSLEEDKSKSEPHKLGLMVADVTGHGPGAAVEAAMLDAILRTFKSPNKEATPSQVLDYVNQNFFTRKARGTFLTANIVQYAPLSRMITYANAGHPHAYLKRGQELIKLGEGGIPIGVLREYQWGSYSQVTQKGDILFIYTDVVIETKNAELGEFGFERLEQALRTSENSPSLLLNHIEQKLKEFCHCSRFQDDMTMCAIQFTA